MPPNKPEEQITMCTCSHISPETLKRVQEEWKNATSISLQFRALLPDGRYFEQGNQFLNPFLRRAAGFIKWGGEFDKDVSDCHEKYLDKPLEDYLEIKIGEDWIKCKY